MVAKAIIGVFFSSEQRDGWLGIFLGVVVVSFRDLGAIMRLFESM